MNKKTFQKFANLYSLSKTLRFELRPVGEMVEYVNKETGEVEQVSSTEKMLMN